MTLLSVSGLDAGYGDHQVLTDVDLRVDRSDYVAVIGPNGAGKSTLLKAVFGLADRTAGRIEFDDTDITDAEPQEIIRLGMNYVPQGNNVFPPLTVEENLRMGAYILDDVPDEAFEAVFERFPELADHRTRKAGRLSGGQQQMLALGRALMLDPDLLVLDEPSAGLAPSLVDDMFDSVDDVSDAGTSILIVEQNATEALRRCDRGYVLVQGQNRIEGEGADLLASQQVREEFLGG
jgi:branched-chain amino acid transport system ATP-binding protein